MQRIAEGYQLIDKHNLSSKRVTADMYISQIGFLLKVH